MGVFTVFAALGLAASPSPPSRKSNAAELAVHAERYVTANGLTVVLSPDPTSNVAVVDLSFAAGTRYEPAGKNGLAHFVEHLVATGSTPDTDYLRMLEARGAIGFNAFTSFDRMSFRVAVPPEELPLALWANADRLGTMPGRITEEELERSRKIVFQERLLRVDDAPYGTLEVALTGVLFPKNHPLHQGILGRRATLSPITVADAAGFAARHLAPANGVLVITGRFDAAIAREHIDATLAKLPPGERAAEPAPFVPLQQAVTVEVVEATARRPRVALAWALHDPHRGITDALSFGVLLLALYTNGLIGISVRPGFEQYEKGGLFVLDVTLPHVAGKTEAIGDAEGILRYLTRALFPRELIAATYQLWDRVLMERLASADTLAWLLMRIETLPSDAVEGVPFTERHWLLGPSEIQETAKRALAAPRLTIVSMPTRPLPLRKPQ